MCNSKISRLYVNYDNRGRIVWSVGPDKTLDGSARLRSIIDANLLTPMKKNNINAQPTLEGFTRLAVFDKRHTDSLKSSEVSNTTYLFA